jgi:hypothetical protein
MTKRISRAERKALEKKDSKIHIEEKVEVPIPKLQSKPKTKKGK